MTWAAQLHEVGSLISHHDYQRHGAYILDNVDAPGFTVDEMHRLSLLVLGHRGKLRKLDADFEDRHFVMQLLCLRLAVEGMVLEWDAAPGREFYLTCRHGWAEKFPQSAHLLQEEALIWKKTPWSLVINAS